MNKAPTEAQVWKQHSGEFAWPTVLLAFLAFGAHGVVAVAHAAGTLGSGWTLLLATLFAYVGFTPLHEASHGNIAGRTGRRGIEALIGWLCAAQLAAPMPAFRVLHLRHHGQTNHPEDDRSLPRVVIGAPLATRVSRSRSNTTRYR